MTIQHIRVFVQRYHDVQTSTRYNRYIHTHTIHGDCVRHRAVDSSVRNYSPVRTESEPLKNGGASTADLHALARHIRCSRTILPRTTTSFHLRFRRWYSSRARCSTSAAAHRLASLAHCEVSSNWKKWEQSPYHQASLPFICLHFFFPCKKEMTYPSSFSFPPNFISL